MKYFFSKYDQIQNEKLVTFIGETLNGKLHFFCSVSDSEIYDINPFVHDIKR